MLPSLKNPTAVARAALSASQTLHAQALKNSVRYFATGIGAQDGKKERVVILGSGWAGYAFARTLDPAKYERIIISPRSYFVFTPLLASTAVGTLEFRTTLESVRRLGRNVHFHQGWADDVDFARKVVRVEESRADDLSSQTILPPPLAAGKQKGGKEGGNHAADADAGDEDEDVVPGEPPQVPKGPITDVPYDKLVVAVGAYSQTFGIEGVRQHAHFLRDIGDARKIRLRVLSLFEQCTSPGMSDESRRRLLHFAIVGGGPTGIEFAAELHDLIHDDLSRIYPGLMPHVQITVYDISPKILPMFDQTLASYAMGLFQRQHIDVKTGHSIQRIRPDPSTGGLQLNIIKEGGGGGGGGDDDGEVGAGMVVWSTGLMQNPFVEKLMRKQSVASMPVAIQSQEADAAPVAPPPQEFTRLARDAKTGSIVVDDRFRAKLTNTPAITSPSTSEPEPRAGDTGPQSSQHLNDVFVIGDCAVIDTQPTLPKTAQVASQEAVHLAKSLNRGNLDRPFRFRNLGTMTYLGNWKAIHQSSADHLTGWAAWVLWRTAYLTRSMSIKNKLLVPVYWFVSWVFGRDISRF